MRASLTLDQLRIFVAVASREHMTRAAEALGLAQSAVSAAVAGLEAQYSTKLFHRVGRGIALTEAGAVFLIEAQAVLGRAAAAEQVLFDLGSLRRGVLTLQASQTIAGYWLPRHLTRFREAYPDVAIHLTIGNTAQVAAAVRDGTAEIGLIEGAIEDEALLSEPVARDQLVVVVAPEHPWAGIASFPPARLLEGAWIVREPGSGTRSVFEAALSGFGLDAARLSVLLELPSNEAVRGAVEAGLGAAALSASVAAPSIEAGLLQAVDLRLPDRPFSLLCRNERYHSRAAEVFISRIKTPVTAR